MMTYAAVEEELTELASQIKYNADELRFPTGELPSELNIALRNLADLIDQKVNQALNLLEHYGHLFPPSETHFYMPATLRVSWDRDTNRCRGAELQLDPAWSPTTVFRDDDDREIDSDSSQCSAWKAWVKDHAEFTVA